MRAMLIAFALAMFGGAAEAREDPYAPYAFLIGEWETRGADGSLVAVQRFSWGPQRSYIFYATATLGADGSEHPHFEGIIVYNAATEAMDFLFALEPGSLAQEHGQMRAEADGAIVREVTLVAGDGAQSNFRQTFRATGAGSASTALMRQAADGTWAPNFPGSDRLVMTRRG